MDDLFSVSFDHITESELRNLVEVRRVREYVGLDYKATSYGQGHAGAVRLLTDVAAMANSRGGFILLGVEEDKNAADGTPKSLTGIIEGDAEATRIQSLCLSSIDERIPGLRVRDIPLSSGRHCVVIQIPNSPKKPHMVVHERHRSFPVRHGRSNALIGMQEVRSMILDMASYQTSLARFLVDRIDANRAIAEGAPFILMMVTPIYVGSDKIDALEESYRKLLESAPAIPDQRYDGIRVGRPKPRVFGIEAASRVPAPDGRYHRFLRLFRSAHLEYYENYAQFSPEDWPAQPMPIYSYRIAIALLHFLHVAKQIRDVSQVTDSLAITLVLGNCAPSVLQPWSRESFHLDDLLDVFIWRDPILKLDMLVNDVAEPNRIAADLLDHLFNAYGRDRNTHFDQRCQFITQ